jgi:hypothetical protein
MYWFFNQIGLIIIKLIYFNLEFALLKTNYTLQTINGRRMSIISRIQKVFFYCLIIFYEYILIDEPAKVSCILLNDY